MTTQTFLQLAPEMGGLRFGPFDGPVQVGSDPKTSQLVLDRSHGIFPSHATIAPGPDGTYAVAPLQSGCLVFVVPQGQQQVWPVRAPVQARPGDTVIFGTPAGPRFQILTVEQDARSASQIVGDAAQRGGERGFVEAVDGLMSRLFGPPTSRGVAGEIQRQAQARMLTRSPWREIYAVYTRVRHGALTSPTFLVSAGFAVLTLLIGGGATCSGLVWAVYYAIMR